MKIEDNHYTYRIETKDPNGGSLDFIDIDTVEPLRCAYDVQDELNLETNEHIKRVEEIVLDANSTEFWYVDEARTSDTHLVCYFEEVELMASKDHPMVDTNRSVFEYGKINSNEHQNTNFICTHVMDNGVSRVYMSIDKTIFEFATFNNETIKHFISNNPVTVWYALRYEIIIPRSLSKGHLLTLGGQTDITLTTSSEQAKLPIMKFNVGDTQYTLDNNPIHINNTQEGTQIRNIVLEGNTPINYARGNGVNTTEATSDTRYDFEPFYDGQATIQGTVEGGYVSAKLYGDTMVNIAKPYGESPLLTATNESTLCDDLLGMNEEGIVLADGEITEGRIYGDSIINNWNKGKYNIDNNIIVFTQCGGFKPNTLYTIRLYNVRSITETAVYDGTETTVLRDYSGDKIYTFTTISDKIRLYSRKSELSQSVNVLILEGDWTGIIDTIEHFNGIGSVVNPTVTWKYEDGTDVYPELETRFTTTCTLNKLPNGVADYIDVVNKVHVQRVGKIVLDGSENWSCPNHLQKDETVVAVLHGQEYGQIYNNGTNASTGLCDKLGMEMGATTKTNIYNPSGTWVLSVLKTELSSSTLEGIKQWLSQKQPTVLGQLKTPIYTPLTEEEIAQLPLSAYADGYVNLSSDQLMPSFEFRMRASNRYQVDMLETGYYYLNAPVGNVKLGTANVDVQQMPCIIKVDNVGTGDSGYRLTTGATNGFNITIPESDMIDGGYFDSSDGSYVQNSGMCYSQIYYEISPNTMYRIEAPANMRIHLYTENQSFIKAIDQYQNNAWTIFTTTPDTKYFRFSHNIFSKKDHTLFANPITLAKLPSHRIPTSFTQGMKCGTDFGYWEGIKEANAISFRTSNTSDNWKIVEESPIENGNGIVLNRIEYNDTIIEDELDIATGKLTRRIGKITFTKELLDEIMSTPGTYGSDGNGSHYVYIYGNGVPIKKKNSSIIVSNIARGNNTAYYDANAPVIATTYGNIWLFTLKDYASLVTVENKMDYLKRYCEKNPIEIYFELEVPEISYVNLSSNQVKTVANTALQCVHHNGYLNAQVKPSHLTYPVPSLVGNRTYTVVHNRKNITGSTKPIELNLGGTVVQLNDASSKTLVKTPSTLAHSNLIFIGGESTVDHIMVLDGDWTNKPIEYFENMMGHDTDAIITIIGDSKIDDVAEQYLW